MPAEDRGGGGILNFACFGKEAVHRNYMPTHENYLGIFSADSYHPLDFRTPFNSVQSAMSHVALELYRSNPKTM